MPGEIVERDMPQESGASASAEALGKALMQFLEQHGTRPQASPQPVPGVERRNSLAPPLGSVVITGAGLGLPGAEKRLMDEQNVARLLEGEQFMDLVPERFHGKMVEKRITRLVSVQ